MKHERAWRAAVVAVLGLSLAGSSISCTSGSSDPGSIWKGTSVDLTAESRWQRDTVHYLASTHLEGRGPGTRGLDLAADYIAEQFRRAGIVPVPGEGYFQPFPYTSGLKVESSTQLSLGGSPLQLNTDFRPNTITARNKAFSGDVVFAGYGITSRQHNYDDYAGLDVSGKVVLVMRYEPRNPDGTSRFTGTREWSAEAGLARKITAAQAKGAAAVVLINPPPTAGVSGPAGQTDDVLSPFQGRGARGAVTVPVVQATRAAIDRALAAAGAPLLDSLVGPIDATGKPDSKPIAGLQASGGVYFSPNVMTVRNVTGLLPGRGALANEYVVVGAHYDHLGMGGSGSLAPGVIALHPGADDNASGTTAMLTIAKRLAALDRAGAGPADRRSILFQAYTVEEQGLIGSQYWVDHPTVPLSSVAYMLNLDMVGRMRDNVLQYGGDGTSVLFDELLAKAYAGTGVTGKSFGRGGIGPSDHASFAQKKIPVLFLFTGLHPQYHRPADTADTINYDGLQKAAVIGQRIVDQLVVIPRTTYVDSADRSRQDVGRQNQFDRPATQPSAAPAAPNERVGLGLMPDMSMRDRGMKIDGVGTGSAAERAGLKPGDILLELGGSRIDTVEDLQQVYDRHKPGDKVKAKYERDGKVIETEVTFSRRSPQT
jgi:Zn-dependent M28 family amino/carboxypeptidase